jgi:phosphoserine phosphatase
MIVVSDMMGTLTTGSPVLGLLDWVKHNQSKARANFYLAAMMPSYLLAKKGLIDWQKWGQELTVKSLSYIKNATPENVSHAAEWITEKDLWKNRREDVIARLVEHRTQGARVYIASSVMEPFIAPFAKRIGAEVIGTPTEIVDGRFRIVGELVSDEKKIARVLSHLGVDRVDFAYGDTILDVPLLEYADHPVAVYPDMKLKAIAMERGWEIIGDMSSYGQ